MKNLLPFFLIVLLAAACGASKDKNPADAHPAPEQTDPSILLNDIWVLESINGKEIADGDFSRERPLLEFHNADKTVMGNTGCNQLNGTYTTEGDKISFGPLITTKMACPGNGEATFIAALDEVNGYKIENLKLSLTAGSEEKLRFKKVD